MIKFKSFFDIEKEEKWLNKQLQKGFICTNINSLGFYTFEKTDKNYILKIDYQDYLTKDKFEDYQLMYTDFGWQFLRGSRSGLQYWQKENDYQNNLYSDRQSEQNYYKRVMNYSASFTLLLFFFCYMLYKDSGLYLTEGLWQMEGALFWKALLFETPFVLVRLCPALMTLFFATGFLKAYQKHVQLKE